METKERQSTNINCVFCKNRWFWSCSAFPNGIPEVVLTGENDHTEPLPNQDNNIVYEPVDNN